MNRDSRHRTRAIAALALGGLAWSAGDAVGQIKSTPAAATAAPDFERDVLPILQRACLRCHRGVDARGRARRPKGGLRLDGVGWIRRGGAEGSVLTPGAPEQSPLYTRTGLPPDDDRRMPRSSNPLDEVDRTVLRSWIESGAPFGDWRGAAGPERADDVPPAALVALLALGEELVPATPSQLDAAGQRAQISPAQPGSALLRIAFRGAEDDTNDDAIHALQPLRAHISHLDLGRTAITDEALRSLARMPHLWRLDLHRTAVTAAGVARLRDAAHLRRLNLWGTQVDDGVLDTLAALPALREVWLWRTAVTEDGIRALRARRPKLVVHWQLELPQPPTEDAATAPRRRR